MKDKIITVTDVGLIESKRDYAGKLALTIYGRSAKGVRNVKIETKIEFDHLPHYLAPIKEEWLKERQSRQRSIADIDKSLGI